MRVFPKIPNVYRGFQAKSENFTTFMLSKLLHRFQPILQNDKDNQVLFVGGPNLRQMNQQCRTATILQLADKSP